MIFFGEYDLQLDEKNRMRIPSKLRNLISQEFYVLNGTGNCLFVMAKEEFERFTEKFKLIPLTDLEAQNAIRKIMASVFKPEEDAQGRFVLPTKAKLYAGIDKRIVFIGANDRMEIWSYENYKNRFLTESCFDETIQTLAKFGV